MVTLRKFSSNSGDAITPRSGGNRGFACGSLYLMQAVIMILCLVVTNAQPVAAQVFRGYYNSGELQYKTKKERRKETIYGYFPNKTVQYVASYRHGKLDGVTREYYPDGVLKTEINYERGKRDGIARFYYENGMLMSKILYDDDRETGHARFYDRDGNLSTSVAIERERLRHRRRDEKGSGDNTVEKQ
jgi:antitoxin component YwqK of YwqJK toxin-antitoxin module